MKKVISIFILILLTFHILGQEPQPYFILDSEINSNVTRDYIGRDFVQMVTGFNSDPAPSYHVLAKTDPLLVFPSDDGDLTGGDPSNNAGGVVGTLPGNLSVSPSGGAVYSIPIDLPPGVSGMTPELGLVYNSQGGNGLLGVGWSLSGLSAITLATTTIYNDGFVDGIDFDDNDKFMLDGQRLISVNTDDTEFRTEIEVFSKIIVKESNSFGPLSFEVYTKDGRILEYGNSSDSKIMASWGQYILSWSLNRISDRSGNYIDYEYYTDNSRMSRIKSISYGGNKETGQSTFYKVEFSYMSGRNDINKLYVNGSKIEQNLLLANINIVYTPELQSVSSYNLLYDDTGFYTHLESVTVHDRYGNIFNPTKFEWGEEIQSPIVESTTNEYENDYTYINGDYNGDGKTDYVRIPNDITWIGNSKKELFINMGDDVFELTDTDVLPANYTYIDNYQPGKYLKNNYDFNGDGLGDLVIGVEVHTEATPTSPAVNQFRLDVYFASVNPTTGDAELSDTPLAFYLTELSSGNDIEKFIFGDFNGDMITDIFFLYEDRTWNIKMGTEFSGYELIIGNGTITAGYKIENADDYNADGKTDIMFISDTECNIYEVSDPIGNYSTLESLFVNTVPGYPSPWHEVYHGDFNGDGMTDVLTWIAGTGWEIHLFTGTDFDWNNNYAPGLGPVVNGTDPQHYIVVADFNGDGKDDIYEYYDKELGTSTNLLENYFYFSNGLSFHNEFIETVGIAYADQFFGIGDFNGDGNNDINYYGGINKRYLYIYPNDNSNLINEITNGLGSTSNIVYTPLTSNDIYTKGDGTESSYPVIDIQPALYVVESISRNDGLGGSNSTNYKYDNAKFHKQGKGFLGFMNFTKTTNPNLPNQIKNISIFDYNEDYYFTFVKNNQVRVGGTEVLISSLTNDIPTVYHFGSKRIFYYIPNSLSKAVSTGDGSGYISTTLTKINYSVTDILYGNLTSVDVYTDSDWLTEFNNEEDYNFYKKTSFIYETPDITNWLVGRIDSEEVNKWDKDDGSIDTKTTTYDYILNKPYVHIKTLTPNNNTSMIKRLTYEYDDYGNIDKITLSAPNFTPVITDRVTEFVFDQDFFHRFLTEEKNTLDGQDYIKSSTYDNVTGTKLTVTDVGGLQTVFDYDGFGRLKQTTYPDGITLKQEILWSSQCEDNPEYGLFCTWSRKSGEQPVLVFCDNLSRELRTVSYDINEQKIFKETQYNSVGEIFKTSNLHYSPSDQLWTSYEYTNTGQVKTLLTPTSTIVNTYNGRETTSLNSTTGIETSKITNAIGQVILATDPGGSVTYSYYSSGHPKAISSGGAATTILYDAGGYKEKLIEPNSDPIIYDYNPFGELISQTNGNNHTYTMVYDNLGRIVTKTLEGSVSDITSYTYCPFGSAGFGQLQKVIKNNGFETSYKYDNLSRLIEKTEKVGSDSYLFNFTYNTYGKLDRQTWPSGFAIDHHYKNGYLLAVERANTGNLIWELTDVNARGQITQFLSGNGLLTSKVYDNYGFPVSIYTENGVQDLEYNFDISTGNLDWRKATISPPYGNHSITENFTYDDSKLKSRLKTWKVSGSTEYSITYCDNGNIDTKSDIGTYKYQTNGAGPHALSKVEAPATDYLNSVKSVEQEITYTEFDKVETIWQGDPLFPEEASVLMFEYDHAQKRKRTELYNAGSLIKTKTFVDGSFEIEENSNQEFRYLHFITAGDGLCAIFEIDNDENETMYFIHKDHLESIETITNNEGEVVEKLNYDPWGRRRNPSNWGFNNIQQNFLFDRGFTLHEHLDDFDLINMNGRVYDPVVGRFLSPDVFVQSPDYTQSINRYSYCFNNPLKLNDPSGYVSTYPGGFKLNTPTKQETITMLITTFATAGIGNFMGTFGVYGASALNNAMLSVGTMRAIAGFGGSFLGSTVSSLLHKQSLTISLSEGAVAGTYGMFSGFFKGASIGLTTYTQSIYSKNMNRIHYVSKIYDKFINRDYKTVIESDNGGLDVAFAYIDEGTGLKDFRWIQTVETNVPQYGATSPYLDPYPNDDNLPFYYTDKEVIRWRNKRQTDLIFVDGPRRPMKDGTYWTAELSVVGKNNRGKYEFIQTVSYGFKIEKYSVISFPFKEVNPSDFHLNILKNF